MYTAADKPGVDPTLPSIPIILGGVERHLVFDFNAIVFAEKATGVDLLHAIVEDISATKLRGLLWAALLKESPELKIEQVGNWINARNAPGIHQCLIAAWFGSVSSKDAEDAAKGEGEAQAVPIA